MDVSRQALRLGSPTLTIGSRETEREVGGENSNGGRLALYTNTKSPISRAHHIAPRKASFTQHSGASETGTELRHGL